MQRKLTITIDEVVCCGLQEQVGRGNISAFVERLVRPHIVTSADLEVGYRAIAADEVCERNVWAWSEGLVGDWVE